MARSKKKLCDLYGAVYDQSMNNLVGNPGNLYTVSDFIRSTSVIELKDLYQLKLYDSNSCLLYYVNQRKRNAQNMLSSES